MFDGCRSRWSVFIVPMSPDQRTRVMLAAKSILDQGAWCVLEVCPDAPSQALEPRTLIFDLVPSAVADVVEKEMDQEPRLNARLTGCDRWTLAPDPGLGAFLCYLAPA